MKHGQGTINWVEGNSYSGEFARNKIHGKGRYKWADGRVYVGDWKES
jgi:hypothetical protein